MKVCFIVQQESVKVERAAEVLFADIADDIWRPRRFQRNGR
jgi:hypothetical protein